MSKVKVISKSATEYYVADGKTIVNVTKWSSGEGVDILIQEGRATLLHGSLMWDEVRLLKSVLKRADRA